MSEDGDGGKGGARLGKGSGGAALSRLGHSRARAALGAICERIRNRTPLNRACALEGVPRSSFYDLLDDDEEAALLVEQARATAELSDEVELRTMIAEEKRTANVMLHLMERLYPGTYGAKQKVEIDARVHAERMSDDEILAEAAVIVERAAMQLPADAMDAEIEEDE